MDEVNFQPGWLRRDVARAAKRMDEWFGGTRMERLSDERLRGIAWEGNSFLASRFEEMAIARELLELRAEAIALTGALKMAAAERDNFAAALSAGPVMPEVPSNTVIYAIEVEKARGAGGAINFYNAIRTALLKEQSDD